MKAPPIRDCKAAGDRGAQAPVGFGTRFAHAAALVALETTIPDAVVGGTSASPGLAIRWVFPSSDGSITRLEVGTTLFGRDATCAGCLPSASVSRTHAEIRWAPRSVPMLRDLDSTNGVFVNGRRVKQAPLKTRDVLRIGDFIGVLVALPADGSTAWTFQEVSKGYWAGPALLAALAPARLVAATDLPVIIQGETGAGKEGAAHAIAAWSGRAGPFVAVNCAALPEALAEGELFGYRKGAFSGAERAHAGFLRAAEGGTLLLDEIADLSLPIQAKLLRAVEQREVVPLGESKPVAIDVRFLAATQSPLRKAVDEKRFRGDLLARLDGLTITIPPLRERVEDVPFLFAKIVEQHRGRTAPPRLDPKLVERLCTHDWPFNVRELALLARRLLALHPDAAVLDHGALAERPAPETGPREDAEAEEGASPDPDPAAILAALRAERGNVKQTAAALGISRGRLYRLMEKIGSVDLEGIRQSDDE
jgi:transcriptional regulator with AAA-type ATPase domain